MRMGKKTHGVADSRVEVLTGVNDDKNCSPDNVKNAASDLKENVNEKTRCKGRKIVVKTDQS